MHGNLKGINKTRYFISVMLYSIEWAHRIIKELRPHQEKKGFINVLPIPLDNK